jgi:hypothetical protein
MLTPSKDKPTQTEIELTMAATILIINVKKLLLDYEDLATKHDEIPSPEMQLAMENSMDKLTFAITSKADLIDLSHQLSNQIYATLKHEQLDT